MEDEEFVESADRLGNLSLRGKGGNRGKGGRGRGKGGRGGGGGSQDRESQISRALSQLLRHQAENAGIGLDGEGYAPLDKVLQWPRIRSLNPSFDEIRRVVADNAKQRFALKPKDPSLNPSSDPASADVNTDPAAWLIRANQGHSIALADEGLHTPVTLEAGNIPEVVVHGTYFAFWNAIVEAGGLKKMGRQHVHFGTGLLPQDDDGDGGAGDGGGDSSEKGGEKGKKDKNVHGDGDKDGKRGEKKQPTVISGMRSDAELLVFVDVERSLRDGGVRWWISANGVVLTDGNADGVVPLKYFKEVRGRRQGVGVLWREGEKVAELPEEVVARVPMGKGRGGGRGGRGGRGGGKRGKGRE
ncbi:RNA 2'-phosphotransferase, Tpt1 [Hypoxylon sp. FL1150]|nr:RNA 2'-phosphotransferase, Tpt1 [Hypoxylon sp. FL1150]